MARLQPAERKAEREDSRDSDENEKCGHTRPGLAAQL